MKLDCRKYFAAAHPQVFEPYGGPSSLPTLERASELLHEMPEGLIHLCGSINVHLLHNVLRIFDTAERRSRSRGMNGFNQASFVTIAITFLIRRIAALAEYGLEGHAIE